MARVKRGVQARRRHKKILKQAKGYYGARSRVFRVAVQAVTKAGQYAYRDRKVRKRQEAELRQKLSPWRKKQGNLETRMEQLQQELAGVEQPLSDPTIYDDSAKVKLKELLAQQTGLKRELDDVEAEWLEVSETVENLEAELAG